MQMIGVIRVASWAKHRLERTACVAAQRGEEQGLRRAAAMGANVEALTVLKHDRAPIERIAESVFGQFACARARSADIGRDLVERRNTRGHMPSSLALGMIAHEAGIGLGG